MIPKPNIRYLSERLAVTVSPYTFYIEVNSIVIPITIPDGFVFEVSGPGVFTKLLGLGVYEKVGVAVLIHDYLYWIEGELKMGLKLNRKFVDKLFISQLRELGLHKWKTWLIYPAVRIGGYYYWRTIK